MKLSARVLGATTVRTLTDRATMPILVIGSDFFTRADLARVRCYNYLAASTLSHVLARECAVENTQHLFTTVPPAALLLPHIGPIALAVLGAAFEIAGLGGAQPLEAWVRQHRAPETPDTFVTVDTLKRQATAREAHRGSTMRRRRDVAAHRRPRRTTRGRHTITPHPTRRA